MSWRAEIIGGGVAGLATAAAMARNGAEVRVHEQAPRITEVGAGLQISPNGMAVLQALGVGDALRAVSIRAKAVRLIDGLSARQVLSLDLAGQAPELEWRFVHRAALINILSDVVAAAGAEIGTGAKIDATEARMFADDGALVVGADGIRSTLRGAILGVNAPEFTGQIAWRAIVQDDTTPDEAQVWMGPGRHIVTYRLPGGRRNIVAVVESSTWAAEGWSHEGDPKFLNAAFSMFHSDALAWLSKVERVNVWGLFSHPVASRWSSEDHAILVGDAAHPMLPFLAQGANMALEDAWVLAEELAKKSSRVEALHAFEAARIGRVRKVVATSAQNARNYHISNPILRRTAHSILSVGGRVAPKAALGRFDWLYRHDVTKN